MKINDICKHLKTFHDRGVVHGNISLSKIFFEKNSYYLSDPSEDEVKYERTHRSLDAWEGNYSLKSDIFALGCTMFEITYGKKLFFYVEDDDQQKQMIYNFSDCDKMCTYFSSYSSEAPYIVIPEGYTLPKNRKINNIIFKCLHCDPSKRITIDEVIELLN